MKCDAFGRKISRVVALVKNEKGFGLIEVLVATALLSIIAGAFLSALITSALAATKADSMATAEALAKSQLEYIKQADFDRVNDPPNYAKMPGLQDFLDEHPDYAMTVDAERLSIDDPQSIQDITVTVTRGTPAPNWITCQ